MVFSANKQFIMTAQKMQVMRSAYYLITLEQEQMSKSSLGCLGKLRSNLAGNEFNIFDKGENPEAKCSLEQIRNQLGSIIFVIFY